MVPFLERCRERYGETFTLRILRAGRLVLISDPPSIKRLFAADRDNRLPEGRIFILEPILGRHSVLLLEGEEHLRVRRLMLPPFHGERMRAYEETIAAATEREIASWPLGETFALHPRMQAITLEVILGAVFGVEDARRRDELRELLVTILERTRSGRAQFVGLATRRMGPLGPWRRFSGVLERTDAILLEQIAERRRAPDLAERQDILSMLCAARFEDGEPMGDREIRDQLMTLLLAGHETTATALAWAIDLLFHNPEPAARLRESVGAGRGDYLDAVGQETLRLRPVVPQVGRQIAEAGTYGGHELAAGTVVMPAIYLVHTRPDVYREPYEFRPERFLDGGPETFSWIPFGGGTRRCLGATFASFEMRVVLRTLTERAELRPASEAPERIVRRNVTLAPRGGVPARLVSRA